MAVFSMAGSNPALPTYPLQRSVRLRSSASATFSRTIATASNRKIWTWSGWVKFGNLVSNTLFSTSTGASLFQSMFAGLTSGSALQFYSDIGAANTFNLVTTQVFRDPSAWYHLVIAFDTTQATASNRAKIYINGVQVTAFSTSTYPTQNIDYDINNNVRPFVIGASNSAAYYDGYLEEINFIDGQALTPSSFGAYNSYGVWSPAKYTGSYGTNGFYLNFQDNSAVTTTANIGIGADSSGNGNYWTSNNISLTAGVTYDSMLDVPTNTSPTNANYCTWNPVNVSGGGTTTITNGNLATTPAATGTFAKVLGTIGMSSGKWYWENTIVLVGSTAAVGIGDGTPPSGSTGLGGGVGELSYLSTGQKYTNAVASAYGATYTTNDVIGVAYDADAGSITFYKNNTSQGTITGLSGTKYPAVGSAGGTNPQYTVNFGQQPFTYTPPTGFNRLNTYNLPDSIVPVGAQYMAASLYTGTGANLSITNTVNGASMQPDFVWIKGRSIAYNNALFDSIRGVRNVLISNSTAAQGAEPAGSSLTAFNSNGFTLGGGAATFAAVNVSPDTFVGWQWRASNASAVTNTSGSISSQVSANQTAGFSIVTYTGTGANATVGHGLGVAPAMIIVKGRTNAVSWAIYHTSLGATKWIPFDTNAALTASTVWNNTAPTSSVLSIGTASNTNVSTITFVAYCFAAVPGYSAFGSYTGNGSNDGPFIYLGFRPRFVLVKRTDAAGNDWAVLDSSRGAYNLNNLSLSPSLSSAESSTAYYQDFLSNGYKIRDNGTGQNANGATYIYACFAENPFKNALAR